MNPAPAAFPAPRGPKGAIRMKPEETLAERFTCSKCKHRGGNAKRIATTGSGLSKLFDIQHNQFMVVSCRQCGFTEFYDPKVLEGARRLGNILDVIFGG
jgi:predicted nucleic-acid-binding Zn-ribbon protein